MLQCMSGELCPRNRVFCTIIYSTDMFSGYISGEGIIPSDNLFLEVI